MFSRDKILADGIRALRVSRVEWRSSSEWGRCQDRQTHNSDTLPCSGMGMSSQYSGFAGQQAEMWNTQQTQPVETFDEEANARAFQEAEHSELEAKQAREREQDADAGKQNVEREQIS